MLLEMRIENFILIDSLNLTFSNGLNVFTGETGAGKSMIIGAINAGLGGKVSGDLIRKGASKAVVQLAFTADNLEVSNLLLDVGIEIEDDLIVITREILPSNRSVIRLNDRVITLSTLKLLSDVLIDVHGQHEHQTLLYPKNHLKYLDLMGPKSHTNLLSSVDRAYNVIKKVQHKITEVNQLNQGDVDINYLKYQITEIDAIQITSKDEDELEDKYTYYKNIEAIFQNSQNISKILNSDDDTSGVKEMLDTSVKLLSDISNFDPKLGTFLQQLNDIVYQVDDMQSEFRNYIDTLDVNESEMYEVEQRMNAINDLKLKYGRTVSEILDKREQLQMQLEKVVHRDDILKELNKDLKESKKTYIIHAKALQLSRLDLKSKFENSVLGELEHLNMKSSEFEVFFNDTNLNDGEFRLSPLGFDLVEFKISTNPGMPLKPLAKIASGGEISRIMLAIKIVLSQQDIIETLIFDEVDTGISGATAITVGEKIHQITKDYQVLCITHLPQIAVMGDTHFLISKSVENGLGITKVYNLNELDKHIEIARMLSGDDQSTTAKQNAKEMLDKAYHYKSIS